jgi:hypothetical protein
MNGDANCEAFASAKRSSTTRAIYESVSSEVAACQDSWLPEFFKGYFDGKKMAEECAKDAVGGEGNENKICIIKPSFIYGGNKFGLVPPRVTSEYGSFIEELLSLGVFTFLADITPGLIKVALRPPSRHVPISVLSTTRFPRRIHTDPGPLRVRSFQPLPPRRH